MISATITADVVLAKNIAHILLENNTRYHFRLSDLVNYWIESLNNSQGLFSKPLVLTNPHTNLEFSIHNLYNIYFKLLDSGFTIPTIVILGNHDMNLNNLYRLDAISPILDGFVDSNIIFIKDNEVFEKAVADEIEEKT